MLDEEGMTRSLDDFHRIWVEPELRRRFGAAGAPPDFRIFECLVRLPPGKPPIVNFNDEVCWRTQCKKAPGPCFDKGDPVYLHQIEHVESVHAPEYDGKPVSFFYIHRIPGSGFRMVFDGTPGLAQAEPGSQDPKWQFSDAVCEYLNAVMFERAIHLQDEQQQALASLGLWAIPSLLPYPLSLCAHLVKNGEHDEAIAVVVRHCCPEWLEGQLDRWLTVPELAKRRELLTQTLAAHRAGQYILTIHTLIPQLEGIVSDRMNRSLPPGEMHFRHESKLRQLLDKALEDDDIAFSFRRVIESTVDFFVKGPVLETFKTWLDDPDCVFPNRHVVLHGKFIEKLYTEENSVKAFLLVDTLAQILSMMGSATTPSPSAELS